MSLGLPPGLTSRPATAADVPAIIELIGACELDADGVAEVDEGDVSFERHGFDEDVDTMLVFDHEELVAWAELYRSRAEADVRPSHRAAASARPSCGGRRTADAPSATPASTRRRRTRTPARGSSSWRTGTNPGGRRG